jgi:hypothetical protein
MKTIQVESHLMKSLSQKASSPSSLIDTKDVPFQLYSEEDDSPVLQQFSFSFLLLHPTEILC